jgi:hypothetical protein
VLFTVRGAHKAPLHVPQYGCIYLACILYIYIYILILVPSPHTRLGPSTSHFQPITAKPISLPFTNRLPPTTALHRNFINNTEFQPTTVEMDHSHMDHSGMGHADMGHEMPARCNMNVRSTSICPASPAFPQTIHTIDYTPERPNRRFPPANLISSI